MTDLDDLPFHYPSEPTPTGATGQRPCRRHTWELRTSAENIAPSSVLPSYIAVSSYTACARCGKLADDVARRRGRTSLRAGKDAERAIARAYGGKRTGQYGGPDDVQIGDLFVVQSKAGGWFSERVWAELAKLPRTGGRIPTLIVSERPEPGHHARRYVVRMMADDLALHGDKP